MRDLTLDNTKCYLMALVVIGHVIEPLIGRFEWVKLSYNYIYLFHMPLFVYISGVFSSSQLDARAIRNVVEKLVVPYVFLEIAYTLFDYVVFSRGALTFSPLKPYWILWYLFSLMFWRALLPYFSRLRYPLLCSVLAGLAVGINNFGYNLSFSRTFFFLPFFVVGHFYHQEILDRLRGLRFVRVLGASVLVALFIGAYLLDAQDISSRWFYGSGPYSQLGLDWQAGAGYRLLTYLASIVLCVAFLAIMPQRKGLAARIGRQSLHIYVLHGFLVKLLLASGFYSNLHHTWEILVLVVCSLALLPLLASYPARYFGDRLMNPLGSWSTRLLFSRS